MECTIEGAEGNTGADSKTRVHQQEEEIGKERKAQREVQIEKRLLRMLKIPKTGMEKHTTGALSTKCGHFTRQVNVNRKVLKNTTPTKKKKKIN